ncbi:MAG: hypothetical protein OXP68_02125 [Anaerolineaceae bacterium]|nr:hypothetical protein [Anaerolineaceae bacterium]
MNENDKHEQEQEQPVTKWPGYAYLVLGFSILFTIAALVTGFLGLQGVIDITGLLHAWLSEGSQYRKSSIVILCLALAFAAGVFVSFALKMTKERSEAASKVAVWVCWILFYPLHVAFRAAVRLAAVILLLFILVGGAFLAYILYTFLAPYLEGAGNITAAILGVGSTFALAGALPNYILPLVKNSMGSVEKVTSGVSDLYMFPEIVVNKSLPRTVDAARKIDREIVRLFINLLLLVLFSMVAVVGFSALDAAVSNQETAESKSSYIFLRNMPWIVGNVQSFFSSAVVFPKDAKPADLGNGDMEGALSLNVLDQRFYQAVYKPFLVDLARCGTSENKVEIELSGFASTSNVNSHTPQGAKIREECSDINERMKPPDGSEKRPDINEVFNLCVAEKRAKFVKDMLEDFVEEQSRGSFKFQVKRWESLKQMQKQTNNKFFCDTPSRTSATSRQHDEKFCPDNGQYDATRGMMNRRVDVAITKTPLCMM